MQYEISFKRTLVALGAMEIEADSELEAQEMADMTVADDNAALINWEHGEWYPLEVVGVRQI